jgi:hypothetical protein
MRGARMEKIGRVRELSMGWEGEGARDGLEGWIGRARELGG